MRSQGKILIALHNAICNPDAQIIKYNSAVQFQSALHKLQSYKHCTIAHEHIYIRSSELKAPSRQDIRSSAILDNKTDWEVEKGGLGMGSVGRREREETHLAGCWVLPCRGQAGRWWWRDAEDGAARVSRSRDTARRRRGRRRARPWSGAAAVALHKLFSFSNPGPVISPFPAGGSNYSSSCTHESSSHPAACKSYSSSRAAHRFSSLPRAAEAAATPWECSSPKETSASARWS